MSAATPLDCLARAITPLMSPQSINSLINTEGGAKHFIGLRNLPNLESMLFFPPLGARNAAMGLSAFALSLRGDRVGVAKAFSLCLIPGTVDAVTCLRRGGNWQMHVAACAVLACVSWGLVRAG